MDRWDYYKDYLVSCLELQKINDETEETDFNLEMCNTFLCKLIDIGQNVRGPYLARLDLFRLMNENSLEPNKLLGEYEDLLVEYFRTFGHKPCCSNDIKKYLRYLEPQKRGAFASRLLQECQTSSIALPRNVSLEINLVGFNNTKKKKNFRKKKCRNIFAQYKFQEFAMLMNLSAMSI